MIKAQSNKKISVIADAWDAIYRRVFWDDIIALRNGNGNVLYISLFDLREREEKFTARLVADPRKYLTEAIKALHALDLGDGLRLREGIKLRFDDSKELNEILEEVEAGLVEVKDEKGSEVVKEENIFDSDAQQLLLEEALLAKVNEDFDKRICNDNILRNVVFLTAMSAYGDEPLNLFLEGPSSTGKTYVVTEVLRYFPKKDVWFLGGLSPTALMHDYGEMREVEGEWFKVVALSNKVLVFLEKPNQATLRKLLPILSHDIDEIEYRITDKNEKGQHVTMKAIIKGFPAVIFCTTESETLKDLSTRNMLYAPEMSEDKIKGALELQRKTAISPWENHREDANIIEKVRTAIRMLKHDFTTAEVAIPDIDTVNVEITRDPRVMRDYKKRLELIKACARLHAYQRYCFEYTMNGAEHQVIMATFFDVMVGLSLYDEIELSTTTGLAPVVINFFNDVLKPLSREKGIFTYTEMKEKHFQVYKQPIGTDMLRKFRINPLEQSGYITGDTDENDRRRKLFTILRDIPTPQITGKKRSSQLSTIRELKKAKEWFLDGIKITEPRVYMYRGSRHPFSFDSVPDISHHMSSGLRYFETIFPCFKEQKDEGEGDKKGYPVLSGKSGFLEEDEGRNVCTICGHDLETILYKGELYCKGCLKIELEHERIAPDIIEKTLADFPKCDLSVYEKKTEQVKLGVTDALTELLEDVEVIRIGGN